MDHEAILAEFAPMVGRIAAGFEHDPSLQQDLVQEMMIGLIMALPNYKGQGALKAFVARVSQNIALSYVRKAVRKKQWMQLSDTDIDLPCDTTSVEDQLSAAQQQSRLQNAVQKLPLNLRQVTILALEGLTYREISEALDISENNAAVRFNRAKALLKQTITTG